MLTLAEQLVLGHADLDTQSRATLGALLGNRATALAKANLPSTNSLGTSLTGAVAGNIQLLSSTKNIDAKVVANTSLFAATANTQVTLAVIRCTSAVAITVAASISIGIAAGFNDIYPNTAMTGLLVNTKAWVAPMIGLIAVATAGQGITLAVNVAATGTSQTIACDLYGYTA